LVSNKYGSKSSMLFTKVKTSEEIIAMRQSGKILAHVLKQLSLQIMDGMSTKDLAEIAKYELRSTGGQPTFLGYYGFPDVICVSVNDEVVHGIPRKNKFLKNGDVVSLDFGVTYDAMITDAAITVIIGETKNKQHLKLVNDTHKALMEGIAVVADGVKVGDISASIEAVLNHGKYGIVRDLVGHGVGHQLHEDPNIPNYGRPHSGPQLHKGMTIAIEPMATLGDFKVIVDEDDWTMRTNDGSIAAHFEHTVLITDKGAEILTKQ
jgi:methionyl aminopeptidase